MLFHPGSDSADGEMTGEIIYQSLSLEKGYHGNRLELHDLFCFDPIFIWMAGFKPVLHT